MLIVVILIIITLSVVGIRIVWKAKKSKQCNKPEGIYYSTIDETKLRRTTNNKLEASHSELTDMQLGKEEPHYMEISKDTPGATVANKVEMQHNLFLLIGLKCKIIQLMLET